MNTIELTPKNVSEILKKNQELCLNRINRYFGAFETRIFSKSKYEKREKEGEPEPKGFTGSFFERYSKKSDLESFDGNDVSAAICLSIEGRGFWVASLLKEDIDLSCFSGLAYEECISDVSNDFFDKPGISQVLDGLLKINGIGLVVASKLLASKRPFLFPIFDRDASKFFGVQVPTNKKMAKSTYLGWCKSWQQVVSNLGVKRELEKIGKNTSIKTNDQISPLRLLDVIFWFEGQPKEEQKLKC